MIHNSIYILLNIVFLFSALFSQEWQIISSPTNQNLSRLDIVSNKLGWAVSYDGLILKFDGNDWIISDSLRRLEQQYSSKIKSKVDWGDILPIRMISDKVGWIGVNNVLSRHFLIIPYNNQQWLAKPNFFPAKIRDIDFLNKNFGIAIGDGVFQYEHGKWNTLSVPVKVDLRAVKIMSPETIILAGANGTILIKNHEWKVLESPNRALIRDMAFINPDEGWFVGNEGTILHYRQGSIELLPSITESNIWAVDMVTPDFGFAVGTNGLILHYDGKNWHHFQTPTKALLHDIEMIDKENGWAVGAWGTILKFGLDSVKSTMQDHRFLFYDQVKYGKNLMDKITDVEAVTFADLNKDNFPDVYLTCSRSLNRLLLNEGNGYYNDFAIESGTGGNVDTRYTRTLAKIEKGALTADFNRDGNTDLFLAGLRNTSRLFMNNGNAVFKNVTSQSGLPDDLNISKGVLADLNEDGYPDMLFADELVGLRIFLNQKYGHFIEQKIDYLNLPTNGLRSTTVIDFNHDHHSDILLFYEQIKPTLLINDGKATYLRESMPLSSDYKFNLVNSVTFADFNNDGFNDIFVCTENGKDALLIFNDKSSEFYDDSEQWHIKQEGRSYSGIAGDFDNDGDIDLFVSRFGLDLLYINENDQLFSEQSGEKILAKEKYLSGFNHGAAMADIDTDGDLDLIVGNRDYWSSLLQNTTNNGDYLVIKIHGIEDTYEALGAKLWIWPADTILTEDNLIAFKELNPSNGILSQNSNSIHVGLPNQEKVNVKIRFLNGIEIVEENISRGTILEIYQSNYFIRSTYKLGRTILQFLYQPQVPLEIIKFILFIIIILGSVRFIEIRYQWHSTKTAIYVVVLLLFYPIFSFILADAGKPYHHAIPFGIIFFALLVLISVNEQIRKSTQRQNLIRKKIQETINILNRIINEDEAIELIFKTLKSIYDYSHLIYYSYYKLGNNFIVKKSDRVTLQDNIKLKKGKVNQLLELKSPIPFEIALTIFHKNTLITEKSLIFPIFRKKELYGILFIGIQNANDISSRETIHLLDYLIQQFANAIYNIRIINDYHEQEKLAAIGLYASELMHDMKNPIDGLRMITEVLDKETKKDDKRKKYIDAFYKGVLKLKDTLLNGFDLVNYTHKIKEKVHLNNMIISIVEHYKQKNYPNVELDLDNQISKVEGNPIQLKHAIENLLENAFEASNYSKIVKVNSKLNVTNKIVRVEVIDNGRGIPESKIDKIFNMFYSTYGNGRGLGLTITQNIIKNHGGFINVESSLKKGTKFIIQLPVRQDNI